jgi:CO/xanthine dehydrogenase Mo-binding subunit
MFETKGPSGLASVGKAERRVDAVEKVTGEAVYVSDMSLPGMLYAQVKKSPHARARILKVDVSRAEALPGVRAVLVGSELDYRLGLYVVDKDILAKKEVRHYGEAVAAVAADTLEAAREAVELIQVEYEVLTPVLNHMDALKPGAPSSIPTSAPTTTCPCSAPSRGPTSPTSPSCARATSRRASPSPSG